ncbi:MAG: hypothetical protein U5L10_00800 [Candidatus Moranbacteria bacterium]|nr:hypothetical protein [Candidatus Moranbacteria bacterium]
MSAAKRKPEKEYRNFIFSLIGGGVLLFSAGYFFINSKDSVLFIYAWKIISNLWWIILPIPLWKIFMTAWEEYGGFAFGSRQESVCLEFIPPQDVEKSPQIVESIFSGVHTWSKPNLFEKYCTWRPLQDKFSFEIASVGDESVHFFVRCPKPARDLVEAQIYAQYPDAEIFEVDDYTKQSPINLPNKDWDVWGTVLKFHDEENPKPIRTYKNFKEDVTGNMIDPLGSLVEIMNKMTRNEQFWLQIIISPQEEKKWIPPAKEKIDEFCGKKKKEASNGISKIFSPIADLVGNIPRAFMGQDLQFSEAAEEKEETAFNVNQLTPVQQKVVEEMERKISKVGFDTTMRFVYLGRRVDFNKAKGVAGGMGAIKQFNDNNLNSLIPDNRTKTFANYYFAEPRLKFRQRKIVNDFRGRDRAGISYIMNPEELATLFHFPDMSVKSSAIRRVEAKKSEAPANLPME